MLGGDLTSLQNLGETFSAWDFVKLRWVKVTKLLGGNFVMFPCMG
jgi:hypothetical protein